jgi:hypothetical protein
MPIRCFLLMVACLSCLGCRAAAPLDREGPVSSVDDPQTTQVGARAAAQDSVVVAYYFHRTFRCPSCLLMETAAVDVMKEHFAGQMQDGHVVWVPVNIEDPATKALQRQLDVRTNGLVLVRMENGVHKDSKRLDELWGLLSRPGAFAEYLIREIDACLRPAQGG